VTAMRDVFLPETLDDFFRIMEKDPGVALYAGGTDLLVKMRSGSMEPSCLVCIERISALQGVEDQGQEIFIGAGTTHGRLLSDPTVREHLPVLHKAVSVLASPPIRHMGTIGGNIVTASPAGDTLPALYVLGAEAEIRSANQSRRVPIGDFILGPGSVDLRQGEILAAVRIPKDTRWNIHHYEKVGRRKAQACAVASMAALLELSPEGRIENARLAWGSVGPTVVTSDHIERMLKGKVLCTDTLEQLVSHIHIAISPIDDIRASAEYRQWVAGNLIFRLLEYADPDLQFDPIACSIKSRMLEGE
jgi:CO/xanthine dehydrogenase FAD-binding subunit